VIGALLYALGALLLVAGTLWWVRAAPPAGTDPRVKGWRTSVEQLLPDRADQLAAGTVVIRAGGTSEVTALTRPGRHYLYFLCAGEGQVLIRLSSSGADSGRLVRCAERPDLQSLAVALADQFYLMVSGPGTTTVVFRWQLNVASR
jgi:hypothetical protein